MTPAEAFRSHGAPRCWTQAGASVLGVAYNGFVYFPSMAT